MLDSGMDPFEKFSIEKYLSSQLWAVGWLTIVKFHFVDKSILLITWFRSEVNGQVRLHEFFEFSAFWWGYKWRIAVRKIGIRDLWIIQQQVYLYLSVSNRFMLNYNVAVNLDPRLVVDQKANRLPQRKEANLPKSSRDEPFLHLACRSVQTWANLIRKKKKKKRLSRVRSELQFNVRLRNNQIHWLLVGGMTKVEGNDPNMQSLLEMTQATAMRIQKGAFQLKQLRWFYKHTLLRLNLLKLSKTRVFQIFRNVIEFIHSISNFKITFPSVEQMLVDLLLGGKERQSATKKTPLRRRDPRIWWK